MKKVASIVVVVVALLVVMTGMALAGIATTKHNLSSTGVNSANVNGVGDSSEICIYCHTPHGGEEAVAPLWNRTGGTAAGDFLIYSSGTLSQSGGAPAGVSLACLSCHDGVTSLNNLINGGSANSVAIDVNSAAFLGTDLRDDHPIGVLMIGNGDPGLFSAVVGTFVQLFGTLEDTVECASCHNVHDDTNNPFLRQSNAGSGLCLACHDK